MLTHLSLFSGYEGFGLGLRLAGAPIQTIGYVEIDEYCQKLLQARIRDGFLDWAPIVRDVRCAYFGRLAGVVDLITAGFPCQPHSVAGRRAGGDDPRDLWPDTLRVIRTVRPQYVLLENAGVNLRRGPTPAYAYTVLADLAESGYSSRWDVVSAGGAGAPHTRERWFCFSYSDGVGRAGRWGPAEPEGKRLPMGGDEIPGPDGQTGQVAGFRGDGWGEGREYNQRQPRDGGETVANPDGQREQQPEGGVGQERGRPGDGGQDLADFPGPRHQAGVCGPDGKGGKPSEPERRGGPAPNTNGPRFQGYGLVPDEPEVARPGDAGPGANADGAGLGIKGTGRGRPKEPGSVIRGQVPNAQGEQMGTAGQSWPGPGDVEWWAVEPAMGRVVDGHPHRVDQVRALGNGIVPAVVAELLRRLGHGC